jgi:hypothetical protein
MLFSSGESALLGESPEATEAENEFSMTKSLDFELSDSLQAIGNIEFNMNILWDELMTVGQFPTQISDKD